MGSAGDGVSRIEGNYIKCAKSKPTPKPEGCSCTDDCRIQD